MIETNESIRGCLKNLFRLRARLFLRMLTALPFLGSTLWASIPPALNHPRYRFMYRVEIPKPRTSFKTLKVWVPMPAENREQKILNKKIEATAPFNFTQEGKFGNSMIFVSISEKTEFPVKLEATYDVERAEATLAQPAELGNFDYWDPKAFMTIDRKIPLNGVIEETAIRETQGISNGWEKVRKIYKYVVDTMAYSKEGTGWGQGDAIWACSNKRGNCTDFHSLFVGMARSQKIPARFEIGFPIPSQGEGKVPGYHCWARAYLNDKGWIPLDASEAKKAGKLYEYFGRLPADRIHFTTGRDIVLQPPQEGEPLNYFIYPYLELNGKAYDQYKREFEVKSVPLGKAG